jgi:hypothetical protein
MTKTHLRKTKEPGPSCNVLQSYYSGLKVTSKLELVTCERCLKFVERLAKISNRGIPIKEPKGGE